MSIQPTTSPKGIRKHYISVIKHNKLIKPQHNREGSPMEAPLGYILARPENYSVGVILSFFLCYSLRPSEICDVMISFWVMRKKTLRWSLLAKSLSVGLGTHWELTESKKNSLLIICNCCTNIYSIEQVLHFKLSFISERK